MIKPVAISSTIDYEPTDGLLFLLLIFALLRLIMLYASFANLYHMQDFLDYILPNMLSLVDYNYSLIFFICFGI